MRLKAPFLRLVLKNSYMELEMGDVAIFAESRKGKLYAELYIGDIGYVYEKNSWYSYDGEGKGRAITHEDVVKLKRLARRLATLPKYPVLEKLIEALSSVRPQGVV